MNGSLAAGHRLPWRPAGRIAGWTIFDAAGVFPPALDICWFGPHLVCAYRLTTTLEKPCPIPPIVPLLGMTKLSKLSLTHWLVLALILMGCAGRLATLATSLETPKLSGDAWEYYHAASDLVYAVTEGRPPAGAVDRTPGLPVLMAGLFLITHESNELQRVVTALLCWRRAVR